MKLKSYNILFRMFSYLSDKTNGAPFFVKYKLVLGTLILGLASSMSAEAQKKEAVRDTIPLRKPVPADITCYKPSVAVNVERDTVYEGKKLNEVEVRGHIHIQQRKKKDIISCYAVAVVDKEPMKAVEPVNANSLMINPKVLNISDELSGIMCYGIVVNRYDYVHSSQIAEFGYYEVDVRPISLNGDLDAFQEWVQDNIKYTKQMQKNKLQGEVILGFVIDEKGRIVDKRVLRPLSEEADKEALRVLSSSRKWKPGESSGHPVKTIMTIYIKFEGD